ncbi:MAG: hypothetical protein ACLVJ6_07395 [Merdibacter sp.]
MRTVCCRQRSYDTVKDLDAFTYVVTLSTACGSILYFCRHSVENTEWMPPVPALVVTRSSGYLKYQQYRRI